jgi:basic membrane protein A and related proteins
LRTLIKVASAVAAVGLVTAACGSKPADNTNTANGSTAPKAFNACMVLDTGGVDDRSFNQSSYAGFQAANKANSNIKISYVSSNSQNDYTPNLNAEVTKGCSTIIAVGGLMGDNVKTAAAANPKQQFAEIDYPSTGPNVYGIQFNTAQGGFLGGYLAAAYSKSGVVATFGGLNIPPVTIYMDGFWEGVQYYNTAKGKSVKVLGWDETNPTSGTFSNSFTDTNKGKSITDGFINQGADIIFPVAGGAGRGSTASAKASSGKVKVIWVDSDGCVSDQEDCSVFLGSVTKGIETAVKKVVEDAAAGNFKGGTQDVLDLSNGGTDLVYGQQLGSSIPADLQSEITALKTQITSGTIKIKSPSQPK